MLVELGYVGPLLLTRIHRFIKRKRGGGIYYIIHWEIDEIALAEAVDLQPRVSKVFLVAIIADKYNVSFEENILG